VTSPGTTTEVGLPALQFRLELARSHLETGDVDECAAVLVELQEIVRQWEHVETIALDGWASSLTAAERRLLPLLTTHLTLKEIADHLSLSRHTVKSEAISIYRRLGVSSRSEAVARAIQLGLLDQDSFPRAYNLTLVG
jgi:LuxR family maltose regulon positive regulatory protein